MSLINIISPVDYQSINGGTIIQYEINCERGLPVKSETRIWVEYTTSADFSDIQLLEVSDVKKLEEKTWKPVTNSFTGIPGRLKFSVNIPAGDTAIYTRVIFSNPEEKISSKFVVLSRGKILEFNLAKPITTDVSTSKIKVNLDYDVINPEHLTFQVFASNNALDGSGIVWEDMTEAFKANKFYTFNNSTITQGYALNVKVKVTKNNNNIKSSVKIKKINIAHF